MPRSGILLPRSAGATLLGDLAGRRSFITNQRIRGRLRRRFAGLLSVVAKLLLPALCLAALAAAAAAGARWIFTSPRFAVETVEVLGASRLSDDELLDAAAIRPGMNLFAFDPEAVASRLESLPGVSRASVIRSLPNRVALVVEERRPFALAHVDEGQLYWMDEDGVPFAPEPRAVAPEMPVISGLTTDELAFPSGAPSRKTLDAVVLLRTLLRSGSGLSKEISEIDVGRPEGLVLYTVDGVEVRLGRDWREAELARLEGVLAEAALRKEQVASIDLRFRGLVVFTPKAREEGRGQR
jgi:cell division protein FtsQ